MKINEFERIEI